MTSTSAASDGKPGLAADLPFDTYARSAWLYLSGLAALSASEVMARLVAPWYDKTIFVCFVEGMRVRRERLCATEACGATAACDDLHAALRWARRYARFLHTVQMAFLPLYHAGADTWTSIRAAGVSVAMGCLFAVVMGWTPESSTGIACHLWFYAYCTFGAGMLHRAFVATRSHLEADIDRNALMVSLWSALFYVTNMAVSLILVSLASGGWLVFPVQVQLLGWAVVLGVSLRLCTHRDVVLTVETCDREHKSSDVAPAETQPSAAVN